VTPTIQALAVTPAIQALAHCNCSGNSNFDLTPANAELQMMKEEKQGIGMQDLNIFGC
jgi:hypothetical protein